MDSTRYMIIQVNSILQITHHVTHFKRTGEKVTVFIIILLLLLLLLLLLQQSGHTKYIQGIHIYSNAIQGFSLKFGT
jgi:uncharacterized integral membrane protein